MREWRKHLKTYSQFAIVTGTLVAALLTPMLTARGSQNDVSSQPVQVDPGKMGPYRALAQLAYQSVEKGDLATAATLCRILERTWDNGEMALVKTAPDAHEQIDQSMDLFIGPIMNYTKQKPDMDKLKVAYSQYLQKLKLAD
jgi:hypothetical protein